MRTGRETWIKHVDEWLGSGLNQAAFCREAGISYSSFNVWKRRLFAEQALGAQSPDTVSPVSPVTVIEVSGMFASAGRPIRILVGQEMVIEVEPRFCPRTLREVLSAVRAGC